VGKKEHKRLREQKNIPVKTIPKLKSGPLYVGIMNLWFSKAALA
jgi:hypothetical protein